MTGSTTCTACNTLYGWTGSWPPECPYCLADTRRDRVPSFAPARLGAAPLSGVGSASTLGPDPQGRTHPAAEDSPGSSVARWLEPQPDPVGDGASVTDWLLEDLSVHPREPRADLIAELLRVRRNQGFARYGTELRAFNGRDATADALQEAIDLLLYIAQRQIEVGGPYLGRMATVYGLVRWLAEQLEVERG